ncbi:PilW family protein [Methylomarinum vadi]|uniref:PilW family protein n=1 Tax=Methylomarinum vadi TaxID=438855 RepID=UPI0005674348|nr:PilW family protein [Methylomarinum vadi]
MTTRQNQQGMTLVEIMIALLLGAFLLGGVLQIFLSSRQTYRLLEGLSRVQESGRFALDILNKDIRMAGFLGCASLSSITPNVIVDPKNPNPNPPPTSLTLGAPAVRGTDNVANNWDSLACGAANACVAGTDAVTIYYGGSCGGYLVANMATVNANIQIHAPNSCDIDQYDVVIVSDCSDADIFIATSASLGAGKQTIAHANNQNLGNNLSKAYGPDAEVFAFNSSTFYIRTGANGRPSLWRLDNSKAIGGNNPVELLEGIENMQITYGVDIDDDDDGDPGTAAPDGPANYYVSGNNIPDMDGDGAADWYRVVSLRVSILVASDDNLASQALPYDYNGATVTPADRRLRRVFNTTVAVRNRLP